MKRPAIILSVLLAAALFAVFLTRDSSAPRPVHPAEQQQQQPVNSGLLDTARRLSVVAETAEERDQWLETVHSADHELDLAFAAAVREAADYKPPATGPLHDLLARIDQLKVQINADQNRIAQLSKKDDDDDSQLELVKAKLALDQDDLEDAQQDVARQGGDPRVSLQRELQQRDASQNQQPSIQSAPAAPHLESETLYEQARSWLTLRNRAAQLVGAEQQAATQKSILEGRHNDLEKKLNAAPTESTDTAARILTLRHQSDNRKSLSAFDQRIQDCQQLIAAYTNWRNLIDARRRAVTHQILQSIAEILAIVLGAVLVAMIIRRAFRQAERKRLHQMRLIVTVAVQVIALGFILLVVFGPPSQISTIIGLATAGLTVVLKDFIVAFFGWFTLMGKNGIRVGDWVEIEGVSGEVVEIGILKTVLLESGNWTDSGHPTGRQVAFSNGFAMEGHYFNFSTSGQWLWDELQVTLPATGDPYALSQEICKLVEQETKEDTEKAAEDWERATRRYEAREFSAKPAVNLRPVGGGLEVVVRYITRAPQRFAMKSKLFQLIVDLMHKPTEAPVHS